jgi:hypothetical protein
MIGTLAAIAALTLGALPAAGETGTSSEPAGATCPSSNPPTTLVLVAGTPQSATLAGAFASVLQVALESSDGCPVTGVAGVPVTFDAPASGASGVFAASGSSSVTVGSDASGNVSAPTFTANQIAGSYTVTASSPYGSVSFSLTNSAAGMPARIVAISPSSQSTRVTRRYPQPLQVRVLDANGKAVAGADVTFSLGSSAVGSSACGASTSASASFLDAGTQASAVTNASGVASSPAFAANGASGRFSASAAVSSAAGTASAGGEAGADSGNTMPASFALQNLAGAPTRLTAGVGASQSTPAGAAFPLRLAVTVTDAQKNAVPGALITFSAPARGPSGRFVAHPRSARRSTQRERVEVRSNACGVALAPPFSADRQQGGYIVRASVAHASAAFALVNEAPGPPL